MKRGNPLRKEAPIRCVSYRKKGQKICVSTEFFERFESLSTDFFEAETQSRHSTYSRCRMFLSFLQNVRVTL